MPNIPKHIISETHFNTEIANANSQRKGVVIKFSTTRCPPCKVFKPKFERLAGEYSSIVFLEIDAEENSQLANKYNIDSVPTLIFHKIGKPTTDYCGIDERIVRDRLNLIK